jgi:hypothetical protein
VVLEDEETGKAVAWKEVGGRDEKEEKVPVLLRPQGWYWGGSGGCPSRTRSVADTQSHHTMPALQSLILSFLDDLLFRGSSKHFFSQLP